MAIMGLAGAFASGVIVSIELVKRAELPFYYLLAAADLLAATAATTISAAQGDFSRLMPRRWKWVILRGLFGALVLLLNVLAVASGAPMGDASALTSINVVVSALLGRAFLGESLRALHCVALFLSVVGALLISKPESLFGGGGDVPMLGYAIALASGVSSGANFIACRKSQGISPVLLTGSATLQGGIMLVLVSASGLAPQAPLHAMAVAPEVSVLAALALLLLLAGNSWCLSVGGQLCPAAVSSTMFTSTGMMLSYALQTVLHGEPPKPMTLAGAGLMLCAVGLLAFARWFYVRFAPADFTTGAASVASPAAATCAEETASSATGAGDGDDDELESLASFVASELSGLSAAALRQRHTGGAAGPTPQTLGHADA